MYAISLSSCAKVYTSQMIFNFPSIFFFFLQNFQNTSEILSWTRLYVQGNYLHVSKDRTSGIAWWIPENRGHQRKRAVNEIYSKTGTSEFALIANFELDTFPWNITIVVSFRIYERSRHCGEQRALNPL